MAVDLSDILSKIYSAGTIESKRKYAEEMINMSHAKKETKIKALREIKDMTSASRLMFFCTNYSLSGEGSQVFK